MSTPITIGGINCFELWREGRAESGKESFSTTKITATRVLRVAWSDRLRLVRILRGGSTSANTLQAPSTYPDIPEAYCHSIDSEGFGEASKGSGQIAYEWAILTVKYETPDYRVIERPGQQGDLLLRESMDYTSQFLSVPSEDFVWTSDSSPMVDGEGSPIQDHGKIMGMAEYTITAFNHPNPPWSVIENSVGKLHDGVFAPLTRSFADGTLLFMGVHDDVEFILDPFGNLTIPAWTVTYKFAYRRERWNTAFRPSTGEFEDFQTVAGNQLYDSANLYLIF